MKATQMLEVPYLPIGSLLCSGRYRIHKHLKLGGFGITYEVVQTSLERILCLKEFCLKGHSARQDRSIVATAGHEELYDYFLRKFIDEGRRLAELNHPHIVRVIDSFVENGSAYHVMELLPGPSLYDLSAQKGLPIAQCLRYAGELADALAYIHARGMCHFDVKPQNIMLDSYGQTILIDFGSSKQFEGTADEGHTTIPVVSRHYAAPEQANGVASFSPQVDIYALTAVLYTLLTGQCPPQALLYDESQIPDNPALSPEMRSFIAHGMSPFPDKRPSSIAQWMSALQEIVHSYSDSMETEPLVATPSQQALRIALSDLQAQYRLLAQQRSKHKYSLAHLLGVSLLTTGIVAALGWITFSPTNSPQSAELLDSISRGSESKQHSLAQWQALLNEELQAIDSLYASPPVDFAEALDKFERLAQLYRSSYQEYGDKPELRQIKTRIWQNLDLRIEYYQSMIEYDPSTDYEQEYIRPLRKIKGEF